MIIYRVQNEEGVGPYSGDESMKFTNPELYKMVEKHANAEEHPAWGIELPFFTYLRLRSTPWGTFKSGFKTLKALKKWFEGYMPLLKKLNFKVVKLKVPADETLVTERQVIYRSATATIIK